MPLPCNVRIHDLVGAGGLAPPQARLRVGCSATRTPHPDYLTRSPSKISPFSGTFLPMAIGASHHAFLDFSLNSCPRAAVVHQGAHVIDLVAADMIQIENHRIRLAAIKAAMNTQIFNELPAVRLDSLACGFGYLHDHSDFVPCVVLSTVLSIATPAL